MFQIGVVSLIPELVDAVCLYGVVGRAVERRLLGVAYTSPREFTTDQHRTADDRPYGGGPGMVLMCQPLHDAVLAVEGMDPRRAQRILLTPQGRRTTQTTVETLANEERILLIAGHYEGIDERVIETLAPRALPAT